MASQRSSVVKANGHLFDLMLLTHQNHQATLNSFSCLLGQTVNSTFSYYLTIPFLLIFILLFYSINLFWVFSITALVCKIYIQISCDNNMYKEMYFKTIIWYVYYFSYIKEKNQICIWMRWRCLFIFT